MNQIKQIINKLFHSQPVLTDREVSTAAIIFTLAYLLDLIISNIRHIPPSLKSIFVIWYALLSIRFPKLYIYTLALGVIFLLLALVISLFGLILVVNNFFQVGFFLVVIAFVQALLLEKQKSNLN